MLPDGQERQLDRNYFRQAREATYAISDVMRALARRGDVPADGPFYRHLDTVVCLHPAHSRRVRTSTGSSTWTSSGMTS